MHRPAPGEDRQQEDGTPQAGSTPAAEAGAGRYEAYHEWSDEVLRPIYTELGALAPGPRAIKTALAAGLAWWLGNLLGEPRPMFAALGALVAVEATILGSVRRTGLQLVGILGGVVLAAALTYLTEMSALVAGLAVLFGLWAGRLFRSPDRVGVELSVTALLVVALAQGDIGFGVSRLWEVGLGGLVATAINALILPPNYLDDVERSLGILVQETASSLGEAVRVFAELPHHEGAAEIRQRMREIREGIPQLQRALDLAAEALRFSPLLIDKGAALHRCRKAMDLYNKASAHASRVARVVCLHAERPHTWSHDAHLESSGYLLIAARGLALALEEFQSYVREGTPGPLAEAHWAVQDADKALADFYSSVERDRKSVAIERLVDVAAIASEIEHLSVDIHEAIDRA